MSTVHGFTPQGEFILMLAAGAIFGLAAYFTRATRRRVAAAFLATLVFSTFNALWDWAAFNAHWWWSPSHEGPFAPVPVYLAQNLVWGGAFGMLGWRIHRRFGAGGVFILVVLLSAIGLVRDSFVARVTDLLAFGAGYVPRLADFTCWATLLVVAQWITLRMGGHVSRSNHNGPAG